MFHITLIPQTRIYTVIPVKNPLHNLAKKHPYNMCWLTALFYTLQYLGYPNNRKLHYRLSYLLSSSLGLLFISKENGAMYFPRKYELTDSVIKTSLNEIFRKTSLKVRVLDVMSDITFTEIKKVEKYLNAQKKLITIVRNSELLQQQKSIIGEVANHTILIKKFTDLQNSRVEVVYLDPADGRFHKAEIGVNVFMQWIQYIWVVERRYSLFDKLMNILKRNPTHSIV